MCYQQIGRSSSLKGFSVSSTRMMVSVMAVILLFASRVLAQQDAGTLRVFATDSTGAALRDASVRVTNVETNAVLTQPANSNGYAVFAPILRGMYLVDVSKDGFTTVHITNVTIDVNQNRQVEAKLNVANIASTVVVQATTQALQTEDASLATTVTGNQITTLPLAQRRYTDLALLAPGASESTNNPGQRGQGWFVVNGNRSTMNDFLLDGVDNNQNTHNMQSRSPQVVAPSPDALSEFKIQTSNYSAEFGRAAGAVVNASIKSGTNQVHGSAWEFYRGSAEAANTWASNHIGAGKAPLSWNQPGGTLGGPIVKDKLFYFGDYEFLDSNNSVALIGTVPTGPMRNGDFSALKIRLTDPYTNAPFANYNMIPAGEIDKLGQKAMNLYPQPNLTGTVNAGGQPANNYGRNAPVKEVMTRFDIRTDYQRSGANQFFGRYSFSQDNNDQTPTFPGLADGGSLSNSVQYARNQSGIGSWTHVFSSSIVNELRVAYTNTAATFRNATYGTTSGTQFGFVGLPSSLDSIGSLPTFSMSNYSSFGTGNSRPQFHNPWAYEATDSLTAVAGRHTMKFGMDYRIHQDNYVDISQRVVAFTFQGVYTGDAEADLLLGMPQSVSGGTFLFAHERQQVYSGYAQDDWKVRPNLTLNLGLRYDYTTPYYGVGNPTNVNFDYTNKQLVVAPGNAGGLVYGARYASNKYTQAPDFNNFGPRLGIAYQPTSKIVLRSGFGIFFNGEDIEGTTPDLLKNAPNIYPVTLQRVGTGPAPLLLSQPFPANFLNTSTINSATLTFQTFDPNAPSATIQQWNAAVQYQLTPDATIEVAYVGNNSRNLDLGYPANNAPFGVDGSIQANRPLPQFNGVAYLSHFGKGHYNAMDVKLERRFTPSFSTLAAFTWDSGLTNTDSQWASNNSDGVQIVKQTDTTPVPDMTGQWAFPTELTRMRFTDATTWTLPFGRGHRIGNGSSTLINSLISNWVLTGIVTAKTGLPVNITVPQSGVNPATGQKYSYFQNSGGGHTNNGTEYRPNCTGASLYAGISADQAAYRGVSYFNTAAFQVPVNGPGSCSRNAAWGPGYNEIEASVLKDFPIRENQRVEFRLEAFNLFNHPNFSMPASSFGASGFGLITATANNPRQLQFGVKYAF